MQQHELTRLFRRLVMVSAPVPLGAVVSACSGQTTAGGDAGVGGWHWRGCFGKLSECFLCNCRSLGRYGNLGYDAMYGALRSTRSDLPTYGVDWAVTSEMSSGLHRKASRWARANAVSGL